MWNYIRSILVSLFLFSLCTTIDTKGESIWKRTDENSNNNFSNHQLALELGYRIDDQSDTDLPMQYSAQYLGFLTRHFAFQFKLGFAQTVKYSDRSDGKSYTYTIGLRLQQPEKVVTPFAEFGLGLQRSVGNIDSNSYSESRVGIQLGFGLSFNAGRKNHIDLGVNQLLNGYGRVITVLAPEYGGNYKRSVRSSSVRDLFGPAYLYASYRFSF